MERRAARLRTARQQEGPAWMRYSFSGEAEAELPGRLDEPGVEFFAIVWGELETAPASHE